MKKKFPSLKQALYQLHGETAAKPLAVSICECFTKEKFKTKLVVTGYFFVDLYAGRGTLIWEPYFHYPARAD
jgi:hypothetical protein